MFIYISGPDGEVMINLQNVLTVTAVPGTAGVKIEMVGGKSVHVGSIKMADFAAELSESVGVEFWFWSSNADQGVCSWRPGAAAAEVRRVFRRDDTEADDRTPDHVAAGVPSMLGEL